MAAPLQIEERYEVGYILEDSKQPGSFIKILAVREFGYTFQFYDKAIDASYGRHIQTETLPDIRTFTYFKKVS